MQSNDDFQQNTVNEEANSAEESASCVVSEESQTDSQTVTAETSEAASPTAQKSRRSKLDKAFDIVLWVLVVALTLLVLVRLFAFGRITISGKSMTADYYNNEELASYNPELTYHDGDTVRVNKLVSPKRGDVVVFYEQSVNKFKAMFVNTNKTKNKEKYKKLIKRVVALEGDKLWLEPHAGGGYLLVILTADGKTLHEDYYVKNDVKLSIEAFVLRETDALKLGCLENATADEPYVVKEDCFFALGDNRAESNDSRGKLGDVPFDRIYGVVRE